QAVLAKLSRVDRRLAEAQGYCPVLESRLGSMGPPVKITVQRQPVFLCCQGCEKKAQADPARTLTLVEQMKARVRGATPQAAGGQQGQPPAAPVASPAVEAEIKAEIDKLPAADRALALAQRFCAVWEKNRLGSMGVPAKVMVQGQPVFLCCASCREE